MREPLSTVLHQGPGLFASLFLPTFPKHIMWIILQVKQIALPASCIEAASWKF